MPKIKHSKGYDRLEQWTRMELRQLYQAEGYPTKEAIKMAQVLYEVIRNLNRREIYSWNKARDLERVWGAGRALDELGEASDRGWGIDHRQAFLPAPPDHQPAHYEVLRGKRMRLTPEEKAERKRARAEKRRREKEAQKKERFERLMQRAIELRAKQLGQTERGPTAGQRSD